MRKAKFIRITPAGMVESHPHSVTSDKNMNILIVDFGSQTTHLIGRRFRSMGIPVTYTNPDEVMQRIERDRPAGIILSGGPSSVL